jgi:Icc-related predicted phosphoesterase
LQGERGGRRHHSQKRSRNGRRACFFPIRDRLFMPIHVGMISDAKPLRIAAAADLHYSRTSKAHLQPLFAEASDAADVLLLCGDLTDYGHVEEAQVLAEDIRAHATIPVLAVLGNHDFETGHATEIVDVLEKAGVKVLDGETVEIGGVGFAGVCGFGGGFGQLMLDPWGEPLIKSFVQEAVDQSLRLERALGRLHTPQRVALLHYAPIKATIEGENPELFPFLGCSRLEDPINRFKVDIVFHGHAHNGTPEGATTTGVPVFNVALPLLARTQPDARHFRLIELPPPKLAPPIAALRA